MATKVTRYVNAASSGGDGTTTATSGANAAFASQSAAKTALAAAYPSGFAVADVQVDLICGGSTADTAAVTWDIITSATCYLAILSDVNPTPAGWMTDRYRLHTTNTSRAPIRVTGSCRHVVARIQIRNRTDNNGSDKYAFWFDSTYAADAYLDLTGSRIEFDAHDVGSDCFGLYQGAADVRLRGQNVILHIFGVEKANVTPIVLNSNEVTWAYQWLVSGGSTLGGTGQVLAKNCIFRDHGSDINSARFATGSNYNASSRADVTGANSRNSQTFTFEDAANGDLRLASGDGGAKDFGANLSADANMPVTVDMLGTARPQGSAYDIGPHEVAGAPVEEMTFDTQPANVARGQTMAAFTVAKRVGGVVDTAFVGNITIALTTGDGTALGTLTKAAVAGVATFNDVIIVNSAGGAHVFTASSAGLPNVASAGFNVSAGGGTALLTLGDDVNTTVPRATTDAAQRLASFTVRNLDGSFKNDLTGKARRSVNGGASAPTDADMTFVADGRYTVPLTAAEVTADVGAMVSIGPPSNAGYDYKGWNAQVIPLTSFADPETSTSIVNALMAKLIEPGLSFMGWLRTAGAAMAGVSAGAATTNETFRGLRNDGTPGKVRVTITNDGTNRTGRTLDVTDEA